MLKEFSLDALAAIILSAITADVISRAFFGGAPFFAQASRRSERHQRLHLPADRTARAIAGLIGVAFQKTLYKGEDVRPVWGNRPAWLRPVAGGLLLGLLLLALPQMYGVGYPVMDRVFAGHYVLWFVAILLAGKILAASLTLGSAARAVCSPLAVHRGCGGDGLRISSTTCSAPRSGRRPCRRGRHGRCVRRRRPSPADRDGRRAEMTGNFTLTLPIMLAVAVRTLVSRALTYGSIYTTKLLRRGIDIDRPTPTNAFANLTAADAMHRFTVPLDLNRDAADAKNRDWMGLLGPVTRVREPQALFANDSLAQALRQLVLYGRDGLPVIDTDARRVQGWLTNQNVLRAVGACLADVQPKIAASHQAAEWAHPQGTARRTRSA